MSHEIERSDLPVRRLDDRDLPILIRSAKRYHEQADALYPGWSSFASQRHVCGLALDRERGDLWLATGGGVLRWRADRNRYTRYGSEHGLPGNAVTSVAVDRQGRTWAASQAGGLCYREGEIWRPHPELAESLVRCLVVGDTGCLWAGAVEGVYLVEGTQAGTVTDLGFSGDPPRAMALGGNKDVWVCNARGLHRFDGADWTCWRAQPDLLSVAWQGERLWLGTVRGLVCLEPAVGAPQRADAWPLGSVATLAPDADGVWAAISRGGDWQIGLAKEESWWPVRISPLRWQVRDLVPAGDDQVWIGTHVGLLRGGREGRRFHLTDSPPDVIGFSHPDRLPPSMSNLCQALVVHRRGEHEVLWLGSSRGLFQFDLFTERWKRYADRGLIDVRAIAPASDEDDVWVASGLAGLHNVGRGHLPERFPEMRGPVLALALDEEGVCWAAGPEGIYRGKGQDWALILPSQRLPAGTWATALAADPQDRLWIGTSEGLCVYDAEAGTLSRGPDVMGGASVRSLQVILESGMIHLWIGTDRGLVHGLMDNLEAVSGLEGRVVTVLEWDAEGGIMWVGTDLGLVPLERDDKDWVLGREMTERNGGLPSNLVLALALSSGDVGDKRLWVGTPAGLGCYAY